MNKLYWIIGAGALFAAGGAQAQGYYPGANLPPPAYAYDTQQYADPGCGRFTIVGAHAGVTVLGIDIGGGASASVPYCNGGQDYAPQAYAPRPQPVYQPPMYQPPVYQPPVYQPQYYAPRPPMYLPQGYAPPCGCDRPQGW
ncbi:MAG: hypothetical protein ACYDD1_04020 [Caulobacteraceae bacterium]